MKLDTFIKVFTIAASVIGAVWFLQESIYSVKNENQKSIYRLERTIKKEFYNLEKQTEIKFNSHLVEFHYRTNAGGF